MFLQVVLRKVFLEKHKSSYFVHFEKFDHVFDHLKFEQLLIPKIGED